MIPLRRPKRLIFLGQRPVQGPCARATNLVNVNGCEGHLDMFNSVNRVVELPGAGLGRLITINSELNGAI